MFPYHSLAPVCIICNLVNLSDVKMFRDNDYLVNRNVIGSLYIFLVITVASMEIVSSSCFLIFFL